MKPGAVPARRSELGEVRLSGSVIEADGRAIFRTYRRNRAMPAIRRCAAVQGRMGNRRRRWRGRGLLLTAVAATAKRHGNQQQNSLPGLKKPVRPGRNSCVHMCTPVRTVGHSSMICRAGSGVNGPARESAEMVIGCADLLARQPKRRKHASVKGRFDLLIAQNCVVVATAAVRKVSDEALHLE